MLKYIYRMKKVILKPPLEGRWHSKAVTKGCMYTPLSHPSDASSPLGEPKFGGNQ